MSEHIPTLKAIADKLAASKKRMNGYIESFFNQKLKVDMKMVETTDFSKDSTQLAMKKLLNSTSRSPIFSWIFREIISQVFSCFISNFG